jgi:hypothetical protein
MDPLDAADAQHIVIEYARVFERDVEQNRHPARADSLPFAKAIIQTAIRTSVLHLALSGQLTEDLRAYFETAYTGLAEYLDPEIVTLLNEYRHSAEQLTSVSPVRSEKTNSDAWRSVVDASSLVGEIARATTTEAEKLRSEFHGFLTAL